MKIFPFILGVGCICTGCSWPIATNRCAPIVESERTETRFRLRSSGVDCTIGEDSYQKAIQQWLARRATDAAPVEGFFLGRAIDYPWISQYLARAAIHSEKWDPKTGTSPDMHLHALVESFLMEEAFRQRLEAPFADTSYIIRSVGVEKVLVGEADVVLDEYEKDIGNVPFDALLWVDLVKR